MEINRPNDSITCLFDKLSVKIFTEDTGAQHRGPFKVQFNKKICSRLRNVVFEGLLSRQYDGDFERRLVDDEHKFNVKERLSIVRYKFRARGLASKAKRLEKMVSSLDLTSIHQSSVYTGHLDDLHEVQSVIKILLALSNEAKMLTVDPCEVWRKVDTCYQMSLGDQTKVSLDSGTDESKININYEYFQREIFETLPTFGIPKRGFEDESDSLQHDIFTHEPGSCGITEWFGSKTNDIFSERTRSTLFSALIHSRASDMAVKLEIPELSRQQDVWLKPLQSTQITEDEGFEDASDDCRLSNVSTLSNDSGIHDLEIWDKALKMKPSRFCTWEGRKQVISKSCKPYLTEAGPRIINYLCDMRMAEASFLIDCQPEPMKYLQMSEFIRDILMVLIGVPSQTFQLEKSTGSFHVSTTVRLNGCSPESVQQILTELAEMGTNYFRINKFTTCQRHSTLIRSSVLRAFIIGLRAYLQKYRQSVITVQASRVQSILQLSTQFRKEAYELKFLSDVCMCSLGFAAEYGKPKPKFPVGARLLSYLYELCLQNINSPIANLLLFLLKVSCAPYLRFIQQWVFKGKCIDLYKEFMIFENDLYLAHRDKHYWTNGYVMSGTDKMEGVPIFLTELSKDIFICGKSINLLKLCCPEHYICNHEVQIPVMAVVYSLSSLQRISDSSQRYAEEMRKLQENIQLEWKRKKDEELSKQEQLLASERQKASKAIAEIQELVEKAKEVLAKKKKEELNFLKQQMEDAINRRMLESEQAAEEDARFARTSLRYEVTTAKVDDEIAEQARQELIHYYEKLSREAELREKHAVWLARRHALKNERDTFLEHETDKLNQMRNEISKNTGRQKAQNVHETEATTATREKWATASEQFGAGVRSELSGGSTAQSTAKDLIYNSDSVLDSQSRNILPRIGQAMQSTAQELIYPTSRDVVSSTANIDGSDIQIPKTQDSMHVDTKMTRAIDSTIQHLMYPSSKERVETTIAHSNPTVPLSTTSTGVHDVGGRTITRVTDSTIQNLLYRSDEKLMLQPTSSQATGSKHVGGKIVPRAMDSTAQHLMYHSSEEDVVPHRSTRGVGNAFQSTIQKHMYGNGDEDRRVIPNRNLEPIDVMKKILYERDVSKDTQMTTSRGLEQPSVMKDLLYPGVDAGQSGVISTRGRESASTAKSILYHDDGPIIPRSTRGNAPPSTIQNLIYRSESVTEESEQPKRQPLTHEDVWLASQFEPLPDNFDILDEEPFGDIFARIKSDHPAALNPYEAGDKSIVDESLDDENDACNVLCLPVILQRCVMQPLTTQIKVVNSAVVRYFMDNLKLVEHFETLKKFLLMEDGEFSYSLTQQLFEKISSGITPQQLCCISTLNSIMAQSIQSSVYACYSENTRSLSFVLKSIPDIFKRNDVKVLDFIELRYKIQWPVNIIITENCITKYNRIFAFMLQLKRTAWILQDIRYSLKRMDKSASSSPQLRKIHLFRHEMSHLVNDVQGYISNQILHVSWQEFMNSLEQQVRNLDDLHDCHADYLNKSLFRALLNKKAAPVMKIISDLFTKVLMFHTQLVSSSWHVDRSSGHVIHPGFSLLCGTYESFKESTYFLLTIINKLVKRGYQPHLEELLLRLNFNSYYDKNLSGQNTHVRSFEV